MKKTILLSLALAVSLCSIGCSSGGEEPYKQEGPKAEGNESVGAPVSAGGTPGPDGGAPAGKGAPGEGLPTRDDK